MVTSLSKGVHASLAAGVTALDYSFSYDDKGRLSGSTLATGGSTIYQMTMGYNAAGGITSKASVGEDGIRTHDLLTASQAHKFIFLVKHVLNIR